MSYVLRYHSPTHGHMVYVRQGKDDEAKRFPNRKAAQRYARLSSLKEPEIIWMGESHRDGKD